VDGSDDVREDLARDASDDVRYVGQPFMCRYSPQIAPTLLHSALISVTSLSGSPDGLSLDIRLEHSKAISPSNPRDVQPP